ncbi:FAD-dependent oxidoreductase [Streptomyces sp. NPDC048106]|uniref:FAD-binding oxidoreductase n=1 Tax=Streptomyces sp. NPDC048106 TaxID=3155750 RepID=UPI003454B5B2
MPTRRSFLTSAGGLAVAAAVGTASAGTLASAASDGPSDASWARLADVLGGELVRPADSGYGSAKTVYLGEFSAVDPQAVAYCRTPGDVRACLEFAHRQGIELRTRSGGHNLAGWSTGEGLVVDVSAFDQVRAGERTVHLGPGAMSIDALTALEPQHLQIVTGTCPTVRPGGFLSGGGIGHQTRKFGTGSDRLVSARVLLADGRLVTASETSEPELFWALRGGGGGNFGIVLDFEVVPVDQPGGVYFDTEWPWDKAQEVIEAWQRWSVASPHDLGSALLVALPDAAPGSTPSALLTGAYWGDRAELVAGLAELASQAGTRPVRQEVSELAYGDVMRRIYGCGQITIRECHLTGQNPDGQLPRNGLLRERTRIFDRPVTGSVLADALASYDADRRAGQTRLLSFTATGGRANETSRTATAYWHRTAQFMTGFAAMTQNPAPPEDEEADMTAWVDRGFGILEQVSAKEAYVNFPDPRLGDWQRAYYGDNYARLLTVKHAYDPGDVFRHPQSIGS